MNGFSEPRTKKANDRMHRMQTGSVAMRLIEGEMIAKILAKQSSHKLCTLRFIQEGLSVQKNKSSTDKVHCYSQMYEHYSQRRKKSTFPSIRVGSRSGGSLLIGESASGSLRFRC
jgi:hypothetical protein